MLCTQDFFKNITYTNFKYLEIVLCAHMAQDFFYRIFMEISVANLVSMVHIKKKKLKPWLRFILHPFCQLLQLQRQLQKTILEELFTITMKYFYSAFEHLHITKNL